MIWKCLKSKLIDNPICSLFRQLEQLEQLQNKTVGPQVQMRSGILLGCYQLSNTQS